MTPPARVFYTLRALRDQVFISYSHKDQRWLERLHTHLKPFERTHRIQVWDDSRIAPGERWRAEIGSALASARVAVLLVSPDYLASDFVAAHELPPLLEASARDGLTILWVAVSASAYAETEIREYQCVNDPARPLDSLKPARLNEELVKICEAIRRAAAEREEAGERLPQESRRPRPAAQHVLRRKRLIQGAAFLVSVLAVIASVAGLLTWRWLVPQRPQQVFVPVPVDEEFINLEKWIPPPVGWRVNQSQGEGSLEVSNQPQVGYLSGVAYGNFEAGFNLRPLDGRGAAWALRVQDTENYYLFYLSGPGGLYPNRFLSYVVREGRRDPRSERSVNLVEELKAGGYYFVKVTAEGNKITHTLTPAESGVELKLGDFVDPAGAYPRGSIGFCTVGGETFTVDDLFIHPPAAP